MIKNFNEFNEFIAESKNKAVDYEKKFGKRIQEVNDLIEKANEDDIRAIETDSTYESEYKFDKVEMTKTMIKVKYTEYTDKARKKEEKISFVKDRENDYEEVKAILSWIKKTIKKGIREEEKNKD